MPGLTVASHTQAVAGQSPRIVDTQRVGTRSAHTFLYPGAERRVLVNQLAGDECGVGRAVAEGPQGDSLKPDAAEALDRINRPAEEVQAFTVNQEDACHGEQRRLGRVPPLLLPGSYVDQLGDEGKLLGRHAARVGNLESGFME